MISARYLKNSAIIEKLRVAPSPSAVPSPSVPPSPRAAPPRTTRRSHTARPPYAPI